MQTRGEGYGVGRHGTARDGPAAEQVVGGRGRVRGEQAGQQHHGQEERRATGPEGPPAGR
ncbi:MAG: hypothetical protein R2734_19415 [Nocardioides sp.]